MTNSYAVVSALIFALVAIAHLVRLIKQWTVQIGPASVPMSVSWVGLIVAARNLGFLSISITDVFIMKFRRRRQRRHQAAGLKERTPRSLGPERGSLGLGAQR
jgi:hypothetical protein